MDGLFLRITYRDPDTRIYKKININVKVKDSYQDDNKIIFIFKQNRSELLLPDNNRLIKATHDGKKWSFIAKNTAGQDVEINAKIIF